MPQQLSSTDMDIISNISHSKISKDVYRRAYVNNTNVPKGDITVLIVLIWSDDFDPDSSIKANRGGVWIKIVTFIYELFYENKLEDTFTMSIELKDQNHNEIEQRFQKELHDFSNGKYNTF